ncbi:gliding motility-associated C-terminal domain-containing protein [Lentimicrobium sp.]|uniref:T9SS type B sorting domain-containing protein n=1 Tax=Lentimicrobium sp. TaxID=2034841 RepID=UPI0025CF96FF|nr:gliding motility-associated C-terminal domain-containing protein [Lentimicrobium sp.]MCO5257205.1 gliding motility-associated C-terminal domain-containing protein [Lentimicrobium sp.]HOP13281.1 gliding motility-associated C-terminal domain-containing protein [Lentimicrobium sp.]HPF64930.1 gliding motility-associated C-terminal domain-containing protein [Lentimicrobium sp.]HPJ61550.1 gliding motility-associated C-terminal domain-containing protein [Lentimicrobium sp.]HPR26246.1 gliding motil
MKRRIFFRSVFYMLGVFLLFPGIYASGQVNETRVTGGLYCPQAQFVTPVMVTAVENVDSISLTLAFPPQTLTYLSFRQVNPLLQTGFFDVAEDGSRITFTWKSKAPVSITDDKLLELVFETGNQPGTLEWDEAVCYYRQSDGNELLSDYIGAEVELFPSLYVEIEEIDATCSGKCDANIAAYVTGGLKPYQYLWNGEPALFDSIKTGACSGINNLNITDANGCVLDTNFSVSELPSTKVEVDVNPDTVYIQNPVVTFSFTEDQNVVEWLWDFGDGSEKSRERNPLHVYSTASAPDLESYQVQLIVVNSQGCDTLIIFELPVSEAEIFIPNVFTPNGDNINDVFKIAKANDGGSSSGSEYIPLNLEYMRLELVVLDRWGRKVYDNDNYKNDWDGGNLPDGTYYYRLNTYGYFRDETYRGAVTILRGNRN